MGFFSVFKNEKRAEETPSASLDAISSEISVTEEKALEVPAICRAVAYSQNLCCHHPLFKKLYHHFLLFRLA